ncbi:hypothetical protein PDJAM_G00097570 [Pangasius djambal]|uniref:Uncharacterized protein n=1 Tax=Pangasius djambal TaxID=1691987 RepID=A0ACC5Z6J3_9TELE|nr:hypothetical protein [Pangasius djambal]
MADSVGDSDVECRISEGDYVVLKRGDVYKSVQVETKKKIIFEKQWMFLDAAIGELYGSTFEVDAGGKLRLRKPKNTEEDSTEAKEAGQDNRHIVDDGKSQKLTRDDIESLKEQGMKGQEIIQQLINNSTTFRDKTEFAQEKYIKKKKKKYESNITVLKPTSRILAMMYHGREPGKVCHLRYDTLAQMLTLGNIHAGSKIIVFETCAGLVLGSVMERMGGKSRHPAQEKRARMEEKRKRLAATAALLEGRNADGLVIASRFHPCPVLLGLLRFVAPSRPFVVYCQYREPLIECYTKLREQGGAINLKLTDSWLRHYQVI